MNKTNTNLFLHTAYLLMRLIIVYLASFLRMDIFIFCFAIFTMLYWLLPYNNADQLQSKIHLLPPEPPFSPPSKHLQYTNYVIYTYIYTNTWVSLVAQLVNNLPADLGLIPGLGTSSGDGKCYPLQYSGLENSMDCIVHWVEKNRKLLSDFHFHFISSV